MPEVKIGALCWNQYTDWPSLLEAGIRADAPRVFLAVDVGPPLSHRRRLARPQLRGLADDHGLGAGDEPRPHRPDGRCQPAPQPSARGEDGDHAGPHLRRAGDPRHRRSLVRGGAPGLRDGVRVGVPRAAPVAGRGPPDHARHAGRHASPRRRATTTTPRTRATCPGPSRRTCRSASAAAGSRSRSSWSRSTATCATSAAGWPRCSTRRRSS